MQDQLGIIEVDWTYMSLELHTDLTGSPGKKTNLLNVLSLIWYF